MIAITTNAGRALRRMTNTDTYPQAGLSIKKAGGNTFVLSLVAAPADGDVTVPGANVYLDRAAAAALAHATLDAAADASFAGDLRLSRTTSGRSGAAAPSEKHVPAYT